MASMDKGGFLLENRPVSVLKFEGKTCPLPFSTRKLYLLALASIFVPSINKQSKVTNLPFLNEDWGSMKDHEWALPFLQNETIENSVKTLTKFIRDYKDNLSYFEDFEKACWIGTNLYSKKSYRQLQLYAINDGLRWWKLCTGCASRYRFWNRSQGSLVSFDAAFANADEKFDR